MQADARYCKPKHSISALLRAKGPHARQARLSDHTIGWYCFDHIFNQHQDQTHILESPRCFGSPRSFHQSSHVRARPSLQSLEARQPAAAFGCRSAFARGHSALAQFVVDYHTVHAPRPQSRQGQQFSAGRTSQTTWGRAGQGKQILSKPVNLYDIETRLFKDALRHILRARCDSSI